MWIKNTNDSTSRLYEGWMDDEVADVVDDLPGDDRGVVFNGPIQIVESVGEQLIARYEAIEAHSDSASDGEEGVDG